MAASPPRNRSKSPDQQQQQQQQQQHHHHDQQVERNNKITLMNLRSPLAAADWKHRARLLPSDFLDLSDNVDGAAADDGGDYDAVGGYNADAADADIGSRETATTRELRDDFACAALHVPLARATGTCH
jgi:hypothetical protein